MMTTVAALTLGGNWKIYDPDSTKTSFPSFLKLMKKSVQNLSFIIIDHLI